MKKSDVFDKWHEYNKPWLEKCHEKFIAVTFSAGKDSSVCQYFLNEVKSLYNFDVRAFMCTFPHHRYTEERSDKLRKYWKDKGVDLVVQIPEEQDSIMNDPVNPCRPCQNIRKKALPEIFSLIDRPVSEIVIVSGHSLWDIAAYALNRMLAKQLATTAKNNETTSEKRLLEISQRFYPFFTMPEGYSVYRPLVYINQPEIHDFCSENTIPVIEEECRYSSWRPKNNLADFFKRFGYEFDYDTVFRFALEYLDIIELGKITSIERKEYLGSHF